MTTAEVKENIDGWTVSRYRFFYIATGCMFVYNWLPGYLFTALSTFNWMTWIAPQNLTLAILTGSQLGLGFFNPITTFDWNVASSSYNATVTPFWATCTQYFSSLFGGVIILIMYYRNMYNTSCERSSSVDVEAIPWPNSIFFRYSAQLHYRLCQRRHAVSGPEGGCEQ